jgi:acyl carrier protein
MEKKLLFLLKKDFPKLKYNKNDNLKKIELKDINGWDSLSSINFYIKLQKKINIKIDIKDIIRLKTLNDIIVFINKCKKK